LCPLLIGEQHKLTTTTRDYEFSWKSLFKSI
jgi:hypothetical protein